MSVSLQRLLPLYERERAAGRALVLATVVRTEGPTYSKPGALLVMAESGEYAGLLSGGCLEGDLREHALAVLKGSPPHLVCYDMRGPDDLLFGLGSGCEGAMDILIQRVDAADGWEPLEGLAQAWRAQRRAALLLVTRSSRPELRAGSSLFVSAQDTSGAAVGGAIATGPLERLRAQHCAELVASARTVLWSEPLAGVDVLVLVQPPPPRVLLLGAGPDAQPVAELTAFLGWSLTVVDHRSHYAQAARFPGASAVLEGGPAVLSALLQDGAFDAAVVMSHHLATDRAYLAALASSPIPYVGLLGPIVRRDRLLSELGVVAKPLRGRLHSPVGLDLGASNPESIALSIVAEIQAALAGHVPSAARRDPVSAD